MRKKMLDPHAERESALWQTLEHWEGPPVSSDFDARLYARIAVLPAATWRTRMAELLQPLAWRPALPLGLATLAVAGGVMLSRPHPTPRAVPAASVQAVSATEADQIETTLDDLQTLRQLDADAAPGARL